MSAVRWRRLEETGEPKRGHGCPAGAIRRSSSKNVETRNTSQPRQPESGAPLFAVAHERFEQRFQD
jgi:hypothetical protein